VLMKRAPVQHFEAIQPESRAARRHRRYASVCGVYQAGSCRTSMEVAI
jgi:hypothetical protein